MTDGRLAAAVGSRVSAISCANLEAMSRPVRTQRRPTGWRAFVRRYGWRAYALPVLVVITVAGTVRTLDTSSSSSTRSARPTAAAAGHTSAPPASTFQPGATPAPVVVTLKSDDVTSCATNAYAQLILVSISRQHMWVCEQGRQVNQSAVTTGKVSDDDQTPLGSWRVQAKQRDRYLIGPGYKDYVHWWVPFNGDFGLHDAPWQKMPFGSSDWRTGGSHGCVHTPTETMAWVYDWAKVGGTVVTVEA